LAAQAFLEETGTRFTMPWPTWLSGGWSIASRERFARLKLKDLVRFKLQSVRAYRLKEDFRQLEFVCSDMWKP